MNLTNRPRRDAKGASTFGAPDVPPPGFNPQVVGTPGVPSPNSGTSDSGHRLDRASAAPATAGRASADQAVTDQAVTDQAVTDPTIEDRCSVDRATTEQQGAGQHATGQDRTEAPFDTVGRVGELLVTIGKAIRELREIPWWTVQEKALLDVTRAVESTLRSGYGVQVRLAGELLERGTAQTLSSRSAAQLLHETLNITVGQARGRIAVAKSTLQTETPSGACVDPSLPELLDVIDAGAVGETHASIISGAMAKIPSEVDAQTRGLCRDTLLGEAKNCDPDKLRQTAAHIANIVDPDGKTSGKDPRDRAELHIGQRRSDGLTPIRGLLDPLAAETMRQAIEPLAAPRPLDENTPDPRPASLRLAQALTEVFTRYLGAGNGPRDGGVRPQVVVTINLDDLIKKLGSAWADYTGIQSAATARMLACDAAIIPQVLSSDGVVLDQGRAVRLIGPDIRRAIATRDRGCTFPGCDIPPAWCDAHHVIWWRNLGPTSEQNGTLLCRRHHVDIHRDEWSIRMAVDGKPDYIPPPHIDPLQRPRRNTNWDIPRLIA